VDGAYIFEVIVAAESPFSQEIALLHAGRTGVFTVIDSAGLVAASTEESTLAQRSDVPQAARRAGIHHMSGRVIAVAQIPSARWTLAFEQARSEFQGDLTRPLQGAVAAIVLLVVMGGFASVLALTRRLRAAREEQRRLREIAVAREEFASIVSHELRTPVAGLLGFLQTTIDHWGAMGDDERRRAVGRALENAERLQHLSADVLDTSAIELGTVELRSEVLDLTTLAQEAADSVSAAFNGHEILIAADDPVLVTADAARLRQVIGNVLDNAVKNSPPDSPVEVTVSRSGAEGRVAIRDHGTGIASGDRERVFDKYTRAGAALGRGTGLGLYLARQIVETHGGRIWVDETDGVGTTIVLTLPTADAERD
jgi:signal transduction histidine kinase